jgi:hypothetical protein
MIQTTSVTSEEDNVLLSSICKKISELSVDHVEDPDHVFDFRGLRLDWARLQSYLSSGKTPVLEQQRDLAALLNTVAFHTRMVDNLDEMIIETSDLSLFCSLLQKNMESGNEIDQVRDGVKSKVRKKRFARLPKKVVDECKKKRVLEEEFKTELTTSTGLNNPSDEVKERLNQLERKYLDQKEKVKDLLEEGRRSKRRIEINACKGESARARRRFWSHLKESAKGSSDISRGSG